jgi:hypothetical protein
MMGKAIVEATMPRLVACKCGGKPCPPLNIKRINAWKIMCQNDGCPAVVESMTESSARDMWNELQGRLG